MLNKANHIFNQCLNFKESGDAAEKAGGVEVETVNGYEFSFDDGSKLCFENHIMTYSPQQ